MFQNIFSVIDRWEDTGRSVISGLIIKSQKDPKDYVCAYDELLDYLNGPEENTALMVIQVSNDIVLTLVAILRLYFHLAIIHRKSTFISRRYLLAIKLRKRLLLFQRHMQDRLALIAAFFHRLKS